MSLELIDLLEVSKLTFFFFLIFVIYSKSNKHCDAFNFLLLPVS